MRLHVVRFMLTSALVLVGVQPCRAQQQLLTNGGFETLPVGAPWVLGGNFQADARFQNPRSGIGYAYLADSTGVRANSLFGTLSQSFSVPAGISSASITLWVSVTTDDTRGSPWDVLNVTIQSSGGSFLKSVGSASNLTPPGYRQVGPVTLTEFAGQSIRVHMLGTTDAILPTVFRVDDVSVVATFPPAQTPTVGTLAAVPRSSTTADIYGTANPNGAATLGWFEWGSTQSLGFTTSSTALGSGTTHQQFSRTLSGLTPNQTYYFRAVAANSLGTRSGNVTSFTMPPPPLSAPLVTTLSPLNVTTTAATLRGTIDTRGAPGSAWFEWGQSTTYGNRTEVLSGGPWGPDLTFTWGIGPLSPDTDYHYRVVATNAAGQTNGSDVSFRTGTAPQPPGAVTLTAGTPYCAGEAPGVPTVHLSWTSSTGATAIDVLRNGSSIATNLPPSQLQLDDGGSLVGGQSYTYQLRARNAVGPTASNTVAVTIPAGLCEPGPTPFMLTADAPACHMQVSAVRLHWDESTGAATYEVHRNGVLRASGIPGTTFHNTLGLMPGSTYSFRVRAIGPLGTRWSNELEVAIPAGVCSGQAPPAAVASFRFGSIATPQTAGQAFAVQVEALMAGGLRATTFNAQVSLSSSVPAGHSPTVVTFQAGLAQSTVVIPAGLTNVRLSVRYSTAYGESNPFSTSAASATTGKLRATVKNGAGIGVVGATVYLAPCDALAVYEASTDLDGVVTFGDVPAGSYMLDLDVEGLADSTCFPIPAGQSIARSLTIDPSDLPPVLLVPGILGSTLLGAPTRCKGLSCAFPVLPKDEAPVGHLRIHDPTVLGWYGPFTDQLRRRLAESGRIVYDVPWDWRVPLDRAWVKYLLPWLRIAKRVTGSSKVDVVAHSMGGLLVRAYVQSTEYAGDVRKLAMLGTPNGGAATPYFMWEGGDPLAADDFIRFYTHTTDLLYKTMEDERGILFMCESPNGGDALTVSGCTNDDLRPYRLPRATIRAFYDQHISTLGQLMPTFAFLTRPQDPDCSDATVPYNTWLSGLNTDARSTTPRGGTFGPAGAPLPVVQTRLFLSNHGDDAEERASSTVSGIYTACPGDDGVVDGFVGVYPSGRPIALEGESRTYGHGDGTVLTCEASAPFRGGSDASCRQTGARPGYDIDVVVRNGVDHKALWNGFAEEVCTFLAGSPCPSPAAEGGSQPATLPATSSLQLHVQGTVQPLLTDSQGRRAGVATDGTIIESEIPGSALALAAGTSGVTLPDVATGDLQVDLHGVTSQLIDLSAEYVAGEAGSGARSHVLHHGGTLTLAVHLDPEAERPVTFVASVDAPKLLLASDVDGNARLTWTAPEDVRVTGYNVYARRFDEPAFTMIAHTTDTAWQTEDPWNVAGSAPSVSYAVLAVDGEGRESLVPAIVVNDSPIVARFSANSVTGPAPLTVWFTDASLGVVLEREWDLDGDGVVETTDEATSFTYQVDGDYTVELRVAGPEGRDEIQRLGYIRVGADVDSDGELDRDDNCPAIVNDQADGDVDGVGDACDNCLAAPDASQVDTDADGRGDACAFAWADLQPTPEGDGRQSVADVVRLLAIINGTATPSEAELLRGDVAPADLADGVLRPLPKAEHEIDGDDLALLLDVVLGMKVFAAPR